jgi:putative ABC transport system permease protein
MSASVLASPAREATTGNGGFPARRALIRWGWRLLRHEWRQQLLILAMITVAVGATVLGSAVATNTPPPAGAGFGTATDMATLSSASGRDSADIAALARRFGAVEVIENQSQSVPGSVSTYSMRAQDPHGAFGGPMLSLTSGRYPTAADEVALTDGVASELHLTVGESGTIGGATRRVVGIVDNPQNLLDEFALVVPGQVANPTSVSVLFDAPGVDPQSLGPNVDSRALAASENPINPATISLAAATLGMLLIALVGVGGFTVLAQRRLRSIGMLGAQGATVNGVRLVISANGFVTGVVGAVAGFVLGLFAWFAYRPHLQTSAHHVIGAFELPWTVIGISMVLAVLATYLAALRPARAMAHLPIVAALAGRPPAARPGRRWAGAIGVLMLAVAFVLIGLASAEATSAASRSGDKSSLFLTLVVGLVALCIGALLIAPTCLSVTARAASRAPIVVRLALRDLARYRTRSGAALGAISLGMLIAVIICVTAAARYGSPIDYVGPNLARNEIIVYPQNADTTPGASCVHEPGGCPTPTHAQLAAMTAASQQVAASLGSQKVVQLEEPDSALQRAASGRSWNGALYVATPQLLHAYGITDAQVNPEADVLTMRPGLASLTEMQFLYGATKFGPPGPGSPCPPSYCQANPTIQQINALPSGTSAPNTVITERAVRQFHLTTTTAGWLIQAPAAVTAGQISAAQQMAAANGLTVESRNSIPTSSQILDLATLFGILLALSIVAMSVALLRSETAGDLRILTATGANSTARRAISATTAGTLALIGAVIGIAAGYIASIAFFRASQLDTLSSLTSVPVANLLFILIGMPLIAALGGWLLAGREPAGIGRRAQD